MCFLVAVVGLRIVTLIAFCYVMFAQTCPVIHAHNNASQRENLHFVSVSPGCYGYVPWRIEDAMLCDLPRRRRKSLFVR